MPSEIEAPRERLAEWALAWDVRVEETSETQSSLIAFGSVRGKAVVLKVVKARGDEWRAGEVLAAFNGSGAVRVLRHAAGAVLLERAIPGGSLAELSKDGRDDEATEILADTIRRMSAHIGECAAPAAEDWGRSFAKYEATGDTRIPRPLVIDAAQTFARLCASQTRPRLLHGDLQHYNVVHDRDRGWLAIDPKGVLAEVEFEIGAALRNPFERPALLLDPATIQRRVDRFASALGLDGRRILEWGFAQAVLSAVWMIEDGFDVNAGDQTLDLAAVIQRMLA